MPYPPYVPTDWVELETLVDEARMDHIEQGIKSNADAVIDLDARVGAGGGGGTTDLEYEGEYVPATQYTDGDIVVSGGVAYVCVEPTDEAPVPWPSGPAGADAAYIHNQSTPSSVWGVAHGLGKHPSVTVVDSGESIVIPDVHYDNTEMLTITFGSPTSGKAYLN